MRKLKSTHYATLLLVVALSAAVSGCSSAETDGGALVDGGSGGDAASVGDGVTGGDASDTSDTFDTSAAGDSDVAAVDGAASDSAAIDGQNTDAAAAGDASKDVAVTTPTVLSTVPIHMATGVARNTSVSAIFSEAMDAKSFVATTFTLTTGTPPLVVPSKLTYANGKATLWPSAHLLSDTSYAATITTAAKSAAGVAIAIKHQWTFTTGANIGPTLPVQLGMAGHFAILAKSAISAVPTCAVTGDIGVSPAAATYITGFALTADPSNVFSTATQVVGKIYAADYAAPTPVNLTTAIGDLEIAATDANSRAPDVTELGAGNIGGKTIKPGVYRWGTGLLIPTNVTLSGSATDVWIFQIAQSLTVSSGAKVLLAGGAVAKNIFWSAAGHVDLGTTSHIAGVILSKTAITLHTGATVTGRLLAQTAANIDGSTIVAPATSK